LADGLVKAKVRISTRLKEIGSARFSAFSVREVLRIEGRRRVLGKWLAAIIQSVRELNEAIPSILIA